MNSKLFESIVKLNECHFAELPSDLDEPMKNASKEIGFFYSKIGKDAYKIIIKKSKKNDFLEEFTGYEIESFKEGDLYVI